MADDISKIYIWIVVAIGLPGNILVAVAFLTMQKFAPATFFVVVQAILDAASLVGKLTAHQLLRNNVYIGDIGCKSYFLTIFSGTLANWILLLICTERFVTVCYPDRKPLIFTKSNCYVAVSVLSAVFLAFFAGVTCAMRGVDSSGLRCGTYNKYLWFWVHVWFWVNSGLYFIIPCLYVLPVIIVLVLKLHAHGGSEKPNNDNELGIAQDPPVTQDSNRHRFKQDNNERSFTTSVIVAITLFLLMSLPACVYHLSYRKSDDFLIEARWALFEQVQFVLVDSRHAINCYVYCLVAAEFRTQLINLLLCRKRTGKISCEDHAFHDTPNTI